MSRRGACVALLSLALAGCTSQVSGSSQAPPPANPAARTGGTLRVGIVRPASIDPALVAANDAGANVVVHALCDSLLAVDPVTRELRPGVAESWQVLSGGAVVLLRLRKDLHFSDGSKLTAQDVVRSLARVTDPDLVSPAAIQLQYVIGYDAVHRRDIAARSIPGIRAVSASAIQITLARPDGQFLYALTSPWAAPMPSSMLDKPELSAHPVCVGPYRLAADYAGDAAGVDLDRAPGYYGRNLALTRGGAGWADHISFRIYPDREAAAAALAAGAVDVTPLPNDTIARSRADAALQVSVTATPQLEYVGLPFDPPFDKPELRRGLSLALDRTALARTVYADGRTPAVGLLPPTLPGSVATATGCDALAKPAADMAAARSLVAQSGIDVSRLTVPFYFNDEFHNRALADAVSAQWKAAFGLTVTPTPLNFDDLLAKGASSGGFDGAFRMAISEPYPDAGELIGPLVQRDQIGSTNLTRYSSEPTERFLARDARKAATAELQKSTYASLEQTLCRAGVVFPIVWGEAGWGSRRPGVTVAGRQVMNAALVLPEIRDLAVG